MDSRRHIILIAEDEPLLREVIASHFEAAGWQGLQSASAEHALDLITDHSPAVVFTDIQLGGRLSGWDVGKACCEGGVPVVYTSGQVLPKARRRPTAAS